MNDDLVFGFEFVETIPRELEETILYISVEFETATHLCACGCKEKVVTPLAPSGWSLIYNGTTISLSPSIGNWSLKCRSHYFIEKNRIVWVGQWNDEQIEATRKRRNIEHGTQRDNTNLQTTTQEQHQQHKKTNWFMKLLTSFKKE